MHLTKIDPATAKTEGEKALSASGGLLSDASDVAEILASQANGNDYNQITDSYGDNSMNASIESVMVGYKDPRLPVYFFSTPTQAIRRSIPAYGSVVISLPNLFYSGFSKYNYKTTFTVSAPEVVMTAAEVWFLKAEAALRGWANAGDAQVDYETGITTSMQQYGVPGASTAYINDAT